MITVNDFETLLEAHPSLEAVVRMSRDGLPLAALSRGNKPVDEIVSIVAGLYSSAMEANLIRDDNEGRLLFCAEHGSLYCRAFDDQTLLLLLTYDQKTEQQLEIMLDSYEQT
jgi:predicted regulator of Ras-like GTPase activity (Roadblock/LC7/MglB family)